jgi:hypothetical protein
LKPNNQSDQPRRRLIPAAWMKDQLFQKLVQQKKSVDAIASSMA